MAGMQCLAVIVMVVLQQAGRSAAVETRVDPISIDVSESADSGALLYQFPHISGYRYLLSSSPESQPFFLSNADSLATSSKLGHLSNQTLSLSVCEEVDGVSRVLPVQLRVRPNPSEAPVLTGSVAENRKAGTPVVFYNGSLDRILSPHPAVFLSSADANRRPEFGLKRTESGHWQLVTNDFLDYEAARQHQLLVVDGSQNAVARIVVDVDNVDDNLPVFNQVRIESTFLLNSFR
jgi:hypothetical protein